MKKIKLLMIDDNVDLVTMTKEYFKNHASIELALAAHDGMEGLKLIEEKQDEYDIVILDLVMPKKDGISVLEEMRKKSIDKKVIVLLLTMHRR